MTLSENYEKFCEIHLVMLVLFDAINTHGFCILSRFWISRPRKSAPDFHGMRSPKKRTQSEQIHVLLFFSPCQSSIIDFSQWASSGSAARKKAVYEHQIQLVIILHRGNHNPFASICYNPIPHLFFRACNVVTISKYRCFPKHLTFHESFDSKALPWWTSKQYPMTRVAKQLPDVITAYRCKTTDPSLISELHVLNRACWFLHSLLLG